MIVVRVPPRVVMTCATRPSLVRFALVIVVPALQFVETTGANCLKVNLVTLAM